MIKNNETCEENKYGFGLNNIDIGKLNYETPVFKFLKKFYNKDIKDLSCHVYNCEISYNNNIDHILYILNEVFMITIKLNDENIKNGISPILCKFNFKSIYDIEIETKSGIKYLIFKIIKSDDFLNFHYFSVNLRSDKDLFICNHILEKQRIKNWQVFFETKIPIPAPFYYQKHFFLQKINKRGKQQSRAIVFTNKFLLNVSYTIDLKNDIHFEIEKLKWALAIESIKSISVTNKKTMSLKMFIDKSLNSKLVEESKLKLKNKKEREFLFYSEKNLKEFISSCRRIYTSLKKNFLVVSYSN